MNDHTLTVLEYREALSRVALFAQSEPGRQLVMSAYPLSHEEDILIECGITSEALRLLEDRLPDLSQATDTTDILRRLAVTGTVLDPLELYALLQNQFTARQAKAALRDREQELPSMATLAGSMAGIPDWERWVEKAISPKGEILDAASPELARVRKELASCRSSATAKLEAFIRQKPVVKVVQEQYVTLRNGRFVVPAKPEYHRAFEGVVQDTSKSGQTVFVEPLFAVELNNQFAVAQAREREEVRRALARMSDEAAGHRYEMAANVEALARMDFILAKARFGQKVKGVIPAFNDRETTLIDARHPHLVLEPGVECVPIDIQIGDSSSTLVITGPNTGGKTVALKTLGLITLMAQTGIPIPVSEESRLRIFERVFADIGDEQSLSQNLSTFSGHMRVIVGLLESSNDSTLVLLDELGAGTDPQEGSAISIALLEFLHRKGACVVVTTHHNLLKEFAYRASFATNASTVFDHRTLEPTYKLRMGAPGRSHALEVARGLGFRDEIIDRAREVMGSGAVQVDELLGRLTEEVDRESLAREKAETIAHELEIRQKDLKAQEKELNRKGQEEKDAARREAMALLRSIERKGKEILRGMKKEVERTGKKTSLARDIRKMEGKVLETFPPAPPQRDNGPVLAGDEVHVHFLGVRGSVLEIIADGREAEVLSGGIRMRVPTEYLSRVERSGPSKEPPHRAGSVSYDGSGEAPSEINLVGTTVDDALQSLDKFLDRSLLGSGRSIRIVHGKGTGALKKAINNALKEDPRVSAYGPAPLNQGGAGVTVVELKD